MYVIIKQFVRAVHLSDFLESPFSFFTCIHNPKHFGLCYDKTQSNKAQTIFT